MSLHLASDFLTTPAKIARTPALPGVATRLLALVRRLRPAGQILAMTRSGRLSPAELHDVGLRADQIGQAPIWGHGGIMWRP
jgi:hypothetical protein